MGLTAEDMRDVHRLAALAANTPKSRRSEIYTAVAMLFRLQGTELSERERELMCDILKRLALDVEMAVRIALAERLADDPETPLDLLLLLADDTIEVARPIILRSRKITDRDLVQFLANAGVEHQTVCAQRNNIGEPVTERLAQSKAESVLVALVRNLTARITNDTFATLVEKSKTIASLQEPLAHREDLPSPLANRLCVWASDALKAYLIESGRLSPAKAGNSLDEAARIVAAPQSGDARDSGQKLIEKLAIAGQLKPGFLLRVLQQGQTEHFNLAFAKLLEVEPSTFSDLFYRRGPRAVALACRAVGIDKCVFATVYGLSRRARSLNPILSPEDRSEVEAVFSTYSRAEAQGILNRLPHA